LELARHGYGNVVGIDVSIDKVRLAKKRAHMMRLNSKISLVVGYVQYAPFVSESFDKALCNCVLEHVRDDEKVLNEVRRTLKRGETLVLTVPSKTPRIVLPIENSGPNVQNSCEES